MFASGFGNLHIHCPLAAGEENINIFSARVIKIGCVASHGVFLFGFSVQKVFIGGKLS